MITLHPKYEALLARQSYARIDAHTEYETARAAVVEVKARYVLACNAIAALKASQAAERKDLLAALVANPDA